MGYGKEVYTAAEAELNDRRRLAEAETEEHRARFFRAFPRGEEIERELSRTALAAARAVLAGKNVREQLQQLEQRNLSLQREEAALLQRAGFPPDYLKPRYRCQSCGDRGYIDGRICPCMKELLRETAYRRLNSLTPLSLSTFESFSLRYYPDTAEGGQNPRRLMEANLTACMDYAQSFSLSSSNLIFTGSTGLGKTHLSLAIANEALQKGFGVVYGSVNNLMDQLEREHFGRAEQQDTVALLNGCDLLILDDLGTEFRTSFSAATVYHIVNTRLLVQKPTIISTNLSLKELEERYTERFTSRIIGSYRGVLFLGRDVRQQKRMETKL